MSSATRTTTSANPSNEASGATRAELERAILAWMAEPSWRADAARFEALALGLFRFQYAACEPYRRYCDALDRPPAAVVRCTDIPAVPTGAFKEFELRCFPAEATQRTFRTSGTTTERRGALHLDTLALYECSLLASLRRVFLVELRGQRVPMRFLALPPSLAPDSSLTHMFAVLAREEGGADSGFDLLPQGLLLDRLEAAIASARAHATPIVVGGTSFAFVHCLDATAGQAAAAWRLPAGSRVIETGGFKGRSREVPREILRAGIAERFGLDERAVVNQYGMTELGSQFYDSTLVDPDGPRRKLVPPWTRVRFVDPASGQDVAPGEQGIVVIHDLANTASVAAIQTADLGRAIHPDGGFEVMGRAAGAEARGCSIATDAILSPSRAAGGAIGASRGGTTSEPVPGASSARSKT